MRIMVTITRLRVWFVKLENLGVYFLSFPLSLILFSYLPLPFFLFLLIDRDMGVIILKISYFEFVFCKRYKTTIGELSCTPCTDCTHTVTYFSMSSTSYKGRCFTVQLNFQNTTLRTFLQI